VSADGCVLAGGEDEDISDERPRDALIGRIFSLSTRRPADG